MRTLVIVLVVFGFARVAMADDVLFYWADKKNVVHATQNLDEVPEPYRAMYRARLKELEEAKKKQPVAPPEAPTATPSPRPAAQPSVVDQELAKQKRWKEEVAKWRTELRVATEELQRVQSEIDAVNLNPVLRMTPEAQAQLPPLEERRKKAVARVEIARRMLAEDLPQRAKKEGAPPRWLE